jgi:hypothetical protein
MDPRPPSDSEPARPDLDPSGVAGSSPEPPAAPRKRRAALIVGVAVVAALGATGAAAMRFMAGSDAKLLERIPASADAAFSVYLDPAAGQKVNLLRMVTAFPDVGNEQKLRDRVNEALDESLAELGLSHRDLDWVGSQVAGYIDFQAGIEEPTGALMVAVDDEQGASAAVDAFVKAAEDRGETITVEDHDGVSVYVSDQEGGGALAMANGMIVIASSGDVIDDLVSIEADGSLAASSMFTDTMAELPGERLAMAYANVEEIMGALEGSMMAASGMTADQLNAEGFQGVGLTVSAEPDGFAIDSFAGVDASQLSDEQRVLLGSDHTNELIDLVAADAFGVAAQSGLDVTFAEQLEDMAAQDPTVAAELERLGVTGPGGLISILGPDMALEVTRGSALPVEGALMLSTTDPEAMRDLMDRWAREIGGAIGSGGTWADGEHAGVSFVYLDGPAEFPVAYGVIDDVAVVASSPDEMVQIIERSQGGGRSITTDPTYTDAVDRVPHDDGVLFVNVSDIVAFVREQMGAQAGEELDAVDPITSVTAGTSMDPDGWRQSLFVEIP